MYVVDLPTYLPNAPVREVQIVRGGMMYVATL
jgi:hypothetical protein